MGDVVYAGVVFTDAIVTVVQLVLLVVAVAGVALAAIFARGYVVVRIHAVGVALTDGVTIPLIGDRVSRATGNASQAQQQANKRQGLNHGRGSLQRVCQVGRPEVLPPFPLETRRKTRWKARALGTNESQGVASRRGGHTSCSNRRVSTPKPSPFERSWDLIKRVSEQADADDADIVAAGLAFYGTLGLFPALLAMVSLYGLVADPIGIQQAIYTVARSLPPAGRDLVIGELSAFIARDSSSLSLSMLLGFLAVLWSASSAMSVLVRAINVAYDIPERHNFFKRRRVAILFTVAGMFGLFVLIPVVAVLPKLLAFFHIGGAVVLLRWPVMAAVAWLTFALLYRYAAQKSPLPSLREVLPGASAAALLWVGLCAVYSLYVEYFTSFSSTYGALTGVIVLQFWLYVSALILVYGAELNAELARQPFNQVQQGLPLIAVAAPDPNASAPARRPSHPPATPAK